MGIWGREGKAEEAQKECGTDQEPMYYPTRQASQHLPAEIKNLEMMVLKIRSFAFEDGRRKTRSNTASTGQVRVR